MTSIFFTNWQMLETEVYRNLTDMGVIGNRYLSFDTYVSRLSFLISETDQNLPIAQISKSPVRM